eukprot:321743_1
MPSFGDFNKETKDLLTKNYAEKGAWKVESKGKGPEKSFIFNPTAASGKGISMDVEFNMKPFKTKTNITEAGVVKPKVTYEAKPHKIEGSVACCAPEGKGGFDATYEFKNDKVLASVKYDSAKKNVEHFNSLALGSGLSLGSGLTYNLDKPDIAKNWNFGVYYAANGLIANFTTKALASWTVGANYPVTVSGKKINAAFQLDNKFKWTAGGEGPCFNCPDAKLRLKINQDFTVGFAWIRKVSGGWKAAIGGDIKKDGAFSMGTTFTLE